MTKLHSALRGIDVPNKGLLNVRCKFDVFGPVFPRQMFSESFENLNTISQ